MNTDDWQYIPCDSSSSESCQPSSFYLVRGLFKVGRDWHDRGDLGAAEQMYSFILRIKERSPQLQCPEFPQTLSRLAAIRCLDGRFVEAEHLYLRSLGSCAEVFGEENEICAEIMRDYASLLRRLQMTSEAKALERRADGAFPLSLPATI